MTARRYPDLHGLHDAIVTAVAARLPDADPDRLGGLIAAMKLLPRHAQELLDYMHTHPDALTSGDARGPAGLRGLLDVLAAEYPGVKRMCCHRCNAQVRLPYRRDGASVCGNCYRQTRFKVCVRCGELGQPAHREDGGVVCSRCYVRDPARRRRCARCGKLTRVAYRVSGEPLCQTCGPRKLATCSSCGRRDCATAAITEFGPICKVCYCRGREHRCVQCGRITPWARRTAADANTWTCYRCWDPPLTTCSDCGALKPCRGWTTGRPVCATCRSRRRPDKTCARCGQTKKMRTTLPMGPVCGPCYDAIRRRPAACARCGLTRPLVGRNDFGEAVCGPCCDAQRNWICQGCGRVDLLNAEQHCLGCVTRARVEHMLAGPNGTVHPQLGGLRSLLLSDNTPDQIYDWLHGTKWAQLLAELAHRGEPITHDTLDGRPQQVEVHYLRQILVSAGVLAARENNIDSIETWLDEFLVGKPPHVAALLRRYASWSVLRRARSRANRHPRVTTSVRKYAQARLRVAADFLTWLQRDRAISLAEVTQPDVELWIAQGRTTRHRLRDFLRWAHAQRLCADLAVPWLGRDGLAAHIIADDTRWALLRRCLHDETMDLRVRVAGALVLLYGQTTTRIVELTRDHLITSDAGSYLRFGRQPALLPPRLADLVRALADQAAPQRSPVVSAEPEPWLFRGSCPAMHLDPGRLTKILNHAGIYTREGRSGALCSLATDLPAPILADLLGISIAAATRWSATAAKDWGDYLAARSAQPTQPQH